MVWCLHWVLLRWSLPLSVVQYMPWFQTWSEMDYARHMCPVIGDVEQNLLPFWSPQDVDIPHFLNLVTTVIGIGYGRVGLTILILNVVILIATSG